MQRLAIPQRFRLRDTITLEDPLGTGWTWHLRYYGNPEHVAALRESGADRSLDEFVSLQERCAVAAAAEAQDKRLRGQAMREFVARRAVELYKGKVFDIELAPRADSVTARPELLVEHVIERVDNIRVELDNGKVEDRAYTKEIGLEIMQLSQPLPEPFGGDDEEFWADAGTPLGTFYRRWVTHESQRLDQFRQDEVERAGKLSAVSSAGT